MSTTMTAMKTNRILVPLDGSSLAAQALPYATKLAGADGELMLLRIVPEPKPVRAVSGSVVVPADAVGRWADEDAQRSLEREAAELGERDAGPAVRTEIAYGDPAEQILRVAGAERVGLIVLASHGRGAAGRVAFGSVADRVARSSAVPVMIVRPRDPAAPPVPVEIRRLLVPLDGSPLAARALPVAESLATQLKVPVALVRAINPHSILPPFAGGVTIPDRLYEDTLTELEVEAQRTLAAAAATLQAAGLQTETEIRLGPAFAAIADATRPTDIIVLSSHGRSGVGRWLLGSVAEKLVRSGPAPVVIVRATELAEAPARAHETAAALAPQPAR